ncbi:nose resistant to fluoxetine protein 6 [Agrilus planipennis]|uniref:Nose resistant to fluoxetine protein 6 n=1 Tax=Agrilus planipennis TaxID=224129 RepID=A0A7F5QZJ9_AGRPL|nr:nose resistant to fluoxetine protein 6 [Agrilus planipennis]
MCENFFTFFLLCTIAVGVLGRDIDEFLRAQSPVYGISWISDIQDYNTSCADDLRTFLDALDQKHVWALKALDASGKPASSFLWGNNLWIGSETECSNIMNRKPLEINHEKIEHYHRTPYDFPPYPLDFVLVRMVHNNILQRHTHMPLEKLIQLGLCVPKSCDSEEIAILMREYLDSGYFNFKNFYNVSMEIEEINSVWESDLEWLLLPKTIVFLSIYSLTLLLIIVGTVYDVKVMQPRLRKKKEESNFIKNGVSNGVYTVGNENVIPRHSTTTDIEKQAVFKPSFLEQLCQCFSFYNNIKSFLKTRAGYDAIGMVHGFRLFSMLWVIAVHSMFYEIDFFENVPDGFRLSEFFLTQPFNNSTYCVDSFLFLSGFLLSYLYFKTKKGILESKKPFNFTAKALEFISLVMNRFLRLTPPYMVALVTADVLYTWLRRHSVLYSSEKVDEVCPKYWWRNLLYINNLFPNSELCLTWSWYLSADMQFFCIATLILIICTVNFKVAATITIALLFTGMFSLGIASYQFGYVPTMDEQLISLDAIYHLPWQRIGPYIVGFITGYILVVKLDMKLKISKRTKTICWIIFPCINLYIIFGIWGRNLSVEYAAFFMGFSRTFWGVGLAWLFIACCTNHGGTVDKFLSFRGWVPLSKLTYSAYLINPLIMTMFYGTTGSSQHVSLSGMLFDVCATWLCTFFLSLWFSMLFESPYISLTKLVLQRSVRKRPTTTEENKN